MPQNYIWVTLCCMAAGQRIRHMQDKKDAKKIYASPISLFIPSMPRLNDCDTCYNLQGEGEEEEEEEERTIQICPCLPCCPAVRTWPPSSEEARTKGGCMAWFKLIVRWVLFIPAFPFVCLFSWTVPDCSKESNKSVPKCQLTFNPNCILLEDGTQDVHSTNIEMFNF